MTAHPMQPIEYDDDFIIRFRENALVRFLLESGPFDMNMLAHLPGFTAEDRSQLAQLVGYSVSGYGELPYAVRVDEADAIAEALMDAGG